MLRYQDTCFYCIVSSANLEKVPNVIKLYSNLQDISLLPYHSIFGSNLQDITLLPYHNIFGKLMSGSYMTTGLIYILIVAYCPMIRS